MTARGWLAIGLAAAAVALGVLGAALIAPYYLTATAASPRSCGTPSVAAAPTPTPEGGQP